MAGFGLFFPSVFSIPQEEEKNLKKNFLILHLFFDFISNYTNYIHVFIPCQLFPTG